MGHYSTNKFTIQSTLFSAVLVFLLLTACAPEQPQMIAVTEIVQLGEEQIVITRVVELEPTPTATPPAPEEIEQLVSLDLAFTTELPELDPQKAGQKSSYDLVENLFVGLTNFNHETEEIEPELAES